MRIDEDNPLFRKVVTPWYDSNWVCWTVLVIMIILALFSWGGISVARGNPEYHGHIWLPIVLLVLTLWVGGSTLYRLIYRYYIKKAQLREP